MKKHFMTGTGIVAGICLLLGVTTATEPEGAKADNPDKHFMMEAAQGGMAEVALGQLATQKAESEKVKKFGQQMVEDHGKANKELMGLADAEGVTLPKEMSAEAKETQERLSKLSGAEFDRAYMQEMLKDHGKDIAAFQQEAEQGKDQDVKAWAAKTLPKLKEHAQMAQPIAEQVGVKQEAMNR